MELEQKIAAAHGETEVDLLLKGGQIVNVLSGEIHEGAVAVWQDRIVGIGDYPARETLDVGGSFVAPGFIDSHVHIESSMVTPAEYARAVLPLGTTAVVMDPHEIANVLGLDGIRYMLESARSAELDVYTMISSCVPATDMETSGATLTAHDITTFFGEHPRVLGLAEMMNYPGVILRVPAVLDKIKAFQGRLIDGHAPGLSGKDLAAYVAAGIRSDHECTTVEEAREKLRAGMVVMVREGTAAKNLEALLPLVHPDNVNRFVFCTDDRHPDDLVREGHIDFLIRKAVGLGLDPVQAIRMATWNPSRYFSLGDVGAIAPGYQADLVVLDDLEKVAVRHVLKRGRVVVRDGRPTAPVAEPARPRVRSTMNVDWRRMRDLDVPAEPGRKMRVIGIVPDQLLTGQLLLEPTVADGKVVADPARDLLKIAVMERHMASGNAAVGFVQGLGLRHGAIASSVAHDSHNIIVVGTNDADMMTAAIEVVRLRGGLAAVVDDDVRAALPLPVAGLMSEESLASVRERLEELKRVAAEMGCSAGDPFMQLSFLALPVIPELKITDRGLVDVVKFAFVPLFAEEEDA